MPPPPLPTIPVSLSSTEAASGPSPQCTLSPGCSHSACGHPCPSPSLHSSPEFPSHVIMHKRAPWSKSSWAQVPAQSLSGCVLLGSVLTLCLSTYLYNDGTRPAFLKVQFMDHLHRSTETLLKRRFSDFQPDKMGEKKIGEIFLSVAFTWYIFLLK